MNLPQKEDVPKDKLRQMHCEFNPLSRCDGSVMYSQGLSLCRLLDLSNSLKSFVQTIPGATVVIAAVLGPIEVKTQNLSIDGSYLECNYRPKAGLPQVKERIREAAIRDVLELALLAEAHPRAKMSVQVQELEDRGSVRAPTLVYI